MYCQKWYKKRITFKCFQKLQLSIALMQFTVKMVLKTVNVQMLPKLTIIHSFVAIYCQNGNKNVSLSNASRDNYMLL